MPLKGSYLDYYYSPVLQKRFYQQPVGLIESHFTYLDDGSEKHNPAFLNPASQKEMISLITDAVKVYPGLVMSGIQYGQPATLDGPQITFTFTSAKTGQTITQRVALLQFIDDVESSYLNGVLDKVHALRTNVLRPVLSDLGYSFDS